MEKRPMVFVLFNLFFISFAGFIFLFSFPVQKIYAAFDCLTISPSSSAADKTYCQSQLNQIEAELNQLLAQQAAQNKQSGTLKSDVDNLSRQINVLKVKIKARGLLIAKLKVDITDKTNTIQTLSQKINSEHASLAQLLRNTNEFDDQNVVALILSNESISDFYADLESYNSIKQSIKTSVDVINGVRTQTVSAKDDLQKQQNAETDAKAELETAQQQISKSEADQKQLLAISKQKESAYKQLAAQKKAQADKIKKALFQLAGVSQKIEFGTALSYATQVSNKLGIDPAFLLAILTQESNLGSNVGQCYLSDSSTGAGVGKNSGVAFANVMHPTRDVPVFMSMTNDLGVNAYKTAVSCPIGGYGYGGAMGPAQFIPSTWKLLAKRLQSALGYQANPWSPLDAFMASGMYLTDLGATGNSASSQSRAACKYYGSGGATCSYSKSVMNLKAKIQANIDLL